MPSAINKKMLSKSLSEPAVTMDEAVTFRGQQFVKGVFSMYDEKALISISFSLRNYDISIQQGISTKISRRKFNIANLE